MKPGPIWPTAQRFYRRLNRLDLPLGGRRPPARGSAAVRENGSCPCLGEIAHDTHLVCCCLPADLSVVGTGRGFVNARRRGSAVKFRMAVAVRRPLINATTIHT